MRNRDMSRAAMGAFVRDHLPLVTIVVLYLLAGAIVGPLIGRDINAALNLGFLLDTAFWALMLVGLVSGSYLLVFFSGQFGSLAQTRRIGAQRVGLAPRDALAWPEFRRRYLPMTRLAGLFLVLFAIVIFMRTFVGFKGAIPEINPFRWDRAFMLLDRRLHFGYDPWRLLFPVFGHPAITRAIDVLYYSWFPILVLTLVWQGWTSSHRLRWRRRRTRFFVSYVATWILLGTVAATVFSSVGPCYYGLVTGLHDPFQPLLLHLQMVNETHPLIALDVQRYLWEGYSGQAAHAIEGISAMPSLHVAIPVLFAMMGWRTHRWLGIAYTTYAVIVVVGSVHLGWHYAIDGYASAATVPLIWHGSGYAVRWYYLRTGRLRRRALYKLTKRRSARSS